MTGKDLKGAVLLREIRIQGCRCFRDFRLAGLSRVNLFVGDNNSGKTSLLEAVHLLHAGRDFSSWLELGERRGEVIDAYSKAHDRPTRQRHFEVRHFFNDHRISSGSKLVIKGDRRTLSAGLREVSRRNAEQQTLFEDPQDNGEFIVKRVALEVTSGRTHYFVPLDQDGNVDLKDYYRSRYPEPGTGHKSVFLATGQPKLTELQLYWEAIALTEKEESVIAALQIVDPKVQRITFLHGGSRPRVVVKMKGSKEPVPLGSLGDGMTRVLALSICLATAEGGYLLVDELDTGLYYRIQSKIWTLFLQAARALGVQIFATTHSADCLRAFEEAMAEANNGDGRLFRLSTRRGQEVIPISYTLDELETALDEGIEVR